MKFLFSFFLTLCCLPALYAQEPAWFYFREPQPASETTQEKIPDSFHGMYVSVQDTLKTLVVTADSIYANLALPVEFTFEEIAHNPNLVLRDSLLYGVSATGPIKVIRQKDTYFGWLLVSYPFFKPSATQVLRVSGTHLLLSFEEEPGRWNVFLFRKEKEGLSLSQVDHEAGEAQIAGWKEMQRIQLSEDQELVTLSFSAEAMRRFIDQKGFNRTELYRNKL